MDYEDFYRSGSYEDDELGVAIGWVGFGDNGGPAEIRVTNLGHHLFVFVGEDFSDTLSRFQDEGIPESFSIPMFIQMLGRINGWFSGVLIDKIDREALLFNDRFGVERIYFVEDADRFAFASEAKALLRVAPNLRELDSLRTCPTTLLRVDTGSAHAVQGHKEASRRSRLEVRFPGRFQRSAILLFLEVSRVGR